MRVITQPKISFNKPNFNCTESSYYILYIGIDSTRKRCRADDMLEII